MYTCRGSVHQLDPPLSSMHSCIGSHHDCLTQGLQTQTRMSGSICQSLAQVVDVPKHKTQLSPEMLIPTPSLSCSSA